MMEAVFSLLAKGFLLFSNGIVLAPLLLVGFITRGGFFINSPSFKGSVIWGNSILLVLLTMIFNALLKSLFLVPLNPSLGGEGYAFPSGHMQVAVVFYGTMFQAYSNLIFRKILLLIIAGIGYGLIQQGYHNIWDVLGAVVFGAATLSVFAKIIAFPSLQENPSRMGLDLMLLAGIMVAGIAFRTGISPHIEKTFQGLIGFSFLWLGLSFYVWKR